MKKLILLLLATCVKIHCDQPPPVQQKPLLEFKAGYFFFTDKKMRKVYNRGGLDLQLSGTANIWRWVQLYLSAEYLHRSGYSLQFRQKTAIWMLPISVGPRVTVNIVPRVQYYATLGPRYYFLHAHNNSLYVDKTICHNGIGGFVNTGFTAHPFAPSHTLKNLLVDLYAEYAYEHMKKQPSKTYAYGNSVQVGGFSFGGGLGYAF